MMSRIFNLDNTFFRFMGRLGDLAILNILWLICCIPVVTAGASTTALYYAVMKIVRGEDTYAVRMFLHSFRQNMKQGVVLTLFFLLMAGFLFVDIRFILFLDTPFDQLLMVLFLLLNFFFLATMSYAFPVLAQFENGLKNILKNAFMMSLSHFFRTIVIVCLNIVPLLLFLFWPYLFLYSIPLWLVIGVSGTAWINSNLFVGIFSCYIAE